MDRSCSPISEIIPCQKRDGFFMLLENGSVSFRLRRSLYTVASTPMNASLLSRSISSSSVGNMASGTSVSGGDNMSDIFNPVTEIQYEQKSVSEAVRVSKHARIMKFSVNPCTEKNLAILASDGRLIMLDLRLQKKKGKPLTLDNDVL